MFLNRTHETNTLGWHPSEGGALMSPDERFIQELYNRAIVNVYEPWTRRGVSWISRAEARRAAHVVSIARQNLAMLAEAQEHAEPPHAIRYDWQQAA